MSSYEGNAEYVAKYERNLTTLYHFRDELKDYSPLIKLARRVPHLPIRLWHWLFGGIERRLLVGSHPSLWVLNIYKLGYFVSLY